MDKVVMPIPPRIKKSGTLNKGKKKAPNIVGAKGGGRPPATKWNWPPVEERYTKGYDKPHEATGIMFRYYPTVLELSEEFKIPLKTLRAQCTDKGWVEKRDAWIAEQKRLKDAADLKELLDAELRIRRKALKGAEKIIDKVAGTDTQPSLVDGAIPEDLPALALSLRKGQEVAHVAIGLPKDGVRPPSSDVPGGNGPEGQQATVWARMRASRQEIVIGVQVTSN